jgi:hypothetical protein
MARRYQSNDKGTEQLQAEAAANSSGRAKKEWDVYMNTDVSEGGSRDDSRMVAAFQIKTGKSKKDQTPYFMLSGFSKELKCGVTIGLSKQVDKIVAGLIDAGFENQICKVLEDKGILK